MKSLLRHERVRRHASQLWRFAVAGGIAACIDLSSVALFIRAGVPAEIAFVPSSLLAVIFVFFANKYFTFRNRERNIGNQAAKFAVVYGIAIVLNITMSNGFYWIGRRMLQGFLADDHIAVLAKAAAIGVGAVLNYALSHGFIFRRRTAAEEEVIIV